MSLGSPIVLAVGLGDGTAVTAIGRTSMTAGVLASSSRVTLPPNTLRTKDVLNLKATGRISSAVTTPGTAQFDLAFGAFRRLPLVLFAASLAVLVERNSFNKAFASGCASWVLSFVLS